MVYDLVTQSQRNKLSSLLKLPAIKAEQVEPIICTTPQFLPAAVIERSPPPPPTWTINRVKYTTEAAEFKSFCPMTLNDLWVKYNASSIRSRPFFSKTLSSSSIATQCSSRGAYVTYRQFEVAAYMYHILSYSLGSIFYQCTYGYIPV
jgi:hypothetical protein